MDQELEPEVHIDMSSKDKTTNQACQDSCKTTTEVYKEGSSRGTATGEASQDIYKTTGEGSSRGTATDEAFQGSYKTSGEIHEELSSQGTATDEAYQDKYKTTGGRHEEGSSEGMETLQEDFFAWVRQIKTILKSDVMPKAEVNEGNRLLFEAAVKGHWRYIEKILRVNRAKMTAEVMVTENDGALTMLDVAIMAAQDQLVEKLVKHFPPRYKDPRLSRTLYYAARGGRKRMVKALLDQIYYDSAIIAKALVLAAAHSPCQKETIWYLARSLTSDPTSDDFVFRLIFAGHLDICLYLARKYPDSVAFNDEENQLLLTTLSMMTDYFRSGARLNFWEKIIYKLIPLCLVNTSFDDSEKTKMARALYRIKMSLWNLVTITAPFIKRSGESKFRHNYSLKLAKLALNKMVGNTNAVGTRKFPRTTCAVLYAASRGVTEVVELCLEYFPELMWGNNFTKELMKEIVKGRHVELFRLMNAHNPVRCLPQFLPANKKSTNTALMEAVAKWSPRCVSPDVSGAAFLLQRELQWFQAVEVCSFPSHKWMKFQVHRKTYWEDFVEERNDLHKEAQNWMKDTSSSCSLVATLITTVVFAAAFTVPGGNDNNTGIPIYQKNGSFMVFVVADALALFCSITASLMFLAILTSRYAIEDFLHSLPRKMILGLTFLFLSLTFMLVAFGSTLMIVLSDRLKWIYIPITLLAALLVVLFVILQLPLYIEMVKSTFWPHLYRPRKLWK